MDFRCEHCGGGFSAKTSRAKFCTRVECRRERERLRKRRDVAPAVPLAPVGGGGSVLASVVASLTAADRLSTPAGSAAVLLAQRLDSNGDSGSAVASMVRELRAAVAEALAGVQPAADEVDELRRRREERLARSRPA